MRILELGFAVAFVLAGAASFNTFNTGDIKSENEFSIIPGIHSGMTTDEVFEIAGTDYYEREDEINPGEMEYHYQLDKVEYFGIDMPAEMFFEFSPKGELFNYGYHIGCIYDFNTDEYSYPYDESQLEDAYDTIFDVIESELGHGEATSIAFGNVIEEHSWKKFRDNEDIWFIGGTDLWSSGSGVNEILINSADESLRQSPF